MASSKLGRQMICYHWDFLAVGRLHPQCPVLAPDPPQGWRRPKGGLTLSRKLLRAWDKKQGLLAQASGRSLHPSLSHSSLWFHLRNLFDPSEVPLPSALRGWQCSYHSSQSSQTYSWVTETLWCSEGCAWPWACLGQALEQKVSILDSGIVAAFLNAKESINSITEAPCGLAG